MNCKKCGNPLNNGDLVCSHCGEPVSVTPNVGIGFVTPADNINTVSQAVVPPQVGPVVQQPVSVQPVQVDANQAVPGVVQPGIVTNVQPTLQPDGVVQPTSEVQQVVQQPIVEQQTLGQVVSQPQPDVASQQIGVQPMQQPVQPLVSQQPAQPVAPAAVNTGKSGNNRNLVMIILMLLAIIGGLVYIILTGQRIPGIGPASNDTSSSVPSVTDNDTGSNTTNGGGSVATSNTATVAGYTVVVPDELKYEISDNYLTISDDKSMVASFTFAQADYASYKNDTNLLKTEIEKGGVTVDFSNSSFGGKEFLIYKFSDTTHNVNGNYFVSEVKSGEVVAGILYEGSESSSMTSFGYLTQIMNSATGSSSSDYSYILPSVNFDSYSFLKGE